MNHVFGSVYCLLERKDKNIYCKIFSFLKHWAMQHGYVLVIVDEKGALKTDLGTYVFTEFFCKVLSHKICYNFFPERAVFQAGREVLGEDVQSDTCQFHYSQVILQLALSGSNINIFLKFIIKFRNAVICSWSHSTGE